MKRRDLIKRINEIAAAANETAVYTEGGSHTKVSVGTKQTTIPRHNEVNEMTAKAIIRQLGG